MTDVDPVKVHVTGSDIPMGGHKAAPCRRDPTMKTIQLTTNNPVQQVLNNNPRRKIAYVQAFTQDVTLYTSNGDATAGGGGPNGVILPKANTMPYPLPTTGEVWATAGTLPAQICVTQIIED